MPIELVSNRRNVFFVWCASAVTDSFLVFSFRKKRKMRSSVARRGRCCRVVGQNILGSIFHIFKEERKF
jgi:hypothetical protein